jgi:glycosyltransferase involved in cell wall biosynthesis
MGARAARACRRVKRRLLHLITRLPVGGAERLIADIVRKLDRGRYEPLVCCIQARGEIAAEIERSGVRVVCLERMKSRRFDWRAVGELARLLLRERIELVHSHLYHANLYGRLACLRARVPAVVSVHNTYTRPKLHRRLINRFLAVRTRRVIAVSDDIKRDLIRYDGIAPERIVVISNGVDFARLETPISRAQARAQLGIAAQTVAVGCVARLEEQKGHRFLLEAMALLTDLPLRLFIIGDGRLRAELEQRAASLGVAHATVFLGMRQDVPEILRALDIYAMPSLWEGLSIAMLEAMAAGLPVVATDVGGVHQVLGADEYGVRVPPACPGELAQAIRSLAASPERRAGLGMLGRTRALESFSLDAALLALTRVYDEALQR